MPVSRRNGQKASLIALTRLVIKAYGHHAPVSQTQAKRQGEGSWAEGRTLMKK